MIDTGTGLTALGLALGGKDIVLKLLGPTAEYIGEGAKDFTQKRFENVKNIFSNFHKKVGDGINDETKSVSPKVLRGILDDGSYASDTLSFEYFGGVLASSRTGISRDDRGAYFVALISRLSTYQLRTHYLFYHCLKNHFDGQDINIGDGNSWGNLELFVSMETYYHAMDFTEEENKNWTNLLAHSVWGLNKEDLLTHFRYGNQEFIKKQFDQATEAGILFQPTKLGVELFMWAYGQGQLESNHFFDKQIVFTNEQEIKIGKSFSTKAEKELAEKAMQLEREQNKINK